jgi:hypothetical protein
MKYKLVDLNQVQSELAQKLLFKKGFGWGYSLSQKTTIRYREFYIDTDHELENKSSCKILFTGVGKSKLYTVINYDEFLKLFGNVEGDKMLENNLDELVDENVVATIEGKDIEGYLTFNHRTGWHEFHNNVTDEGGRSTIGDYKYKWTFREENYPHSTHIQNIYLSQPQYLTLEPNSIKYPDWYEPGKFYIVKVSDVSIKTAKESPNYRILCNVIPSINGAEVLYPYMTFCGNKETISEIMKYNCTLNFKTWRYVIPVTQEDYEKETGEHKKSKLQELKKIIDDAQSKIKEIEGEE